MRGAVLRNLGFYVDLGCNQVLVDRPLTHDFEENAQS
jgi:hypothetical protein